LSSDSLNEIVKKVSALRQRPEFAQSGTQCANVYQTIFSIKSLRQGLTRPPIELNSDRAPEVERRRKRDFGAVGTQGVGVVQIRGSGPERLQGGGPVVQGAGTFGLQGTGAASIQKTGTGGTLLHDIDLWEDEEEKIIGKADNDLLNIIDTSKYRSTAGKKMRTALRADVHFSDLDYDQMAKTFDISVRNAEEIVKLLKSCFDSRGTFQKPVFDKNLPGFVHHQNQIFDILWEFLKGIQRRSDRLPFLNSLQLLVKEIEQPKQAIKILVSDFMRNPAEVSFLDRNAMVLAIQLLRTYNKEIRMDIEITPEEVLLVKEGLDRGAVRYMAWKIDGEQKRFVEKIVTIRQKILESLEQEDSDAKVLPIRFLPALEREVHIFLALVGGKTATAVIRGALSVYGNPNSQIYLLEKSRQHTAGLLQHLAVLIRILGRIGRKKDFALLNDIKKREQGFISLADEPRHFAQVRRILEWIDSAKNEINAGDAIN